MSLYPVTVEPQFNEVSNITTFFIPDLVIIKKRVFFFAISHSKFVPHFQFNEVLVNLVHVPAASLTSRRK